MFCKYCGKPVEDSAKRCPACGRPTGPLTGVPVKPAADEETVKALQKELEELKERVNTLPKPRRGVALPLLAVLVAAAGLGLGAYNWQQSQMLAQQLREQETAYTQAVAQLEAELEEQRNPPMETEPVEIAGHPTDEEIILAQAEEKCVFTARVIGGYMPYTAKWEKQDPATGDFYPIVNGEDGFRTVEDKGSYQLWLTDAKKEHLGVYRFTVSDNRGETATSRTVELREKGAQQD